MVNCADMVKPLPDKLVCRISSKHSCHPSPFPFLCSWIVNLHEITLHVCHCLSLFYSYQLPISLVFSFTYKKSQWPVAQGWASLEQRGTTPGPPEAARAQRSAGHRGGLGHRGRSMSGRATLQEIGVWVQTKRHVFWRIERTTEWTRERLWVSKTCLLLSSHCLRSLLQVLGRWQVYLRYNIYFKIF
jgi:hypothetical protein